MDEARAVLGSHDAHLRLIKQALGIEVVARGGVIMMEGSDEDVEKAERILTEIQSRVKTYGRIRETDVDGIIRTLAQGAELPDGSRIKVFYRDRVIVPRSTGQDYYIESIRSNDIVFCIGPAGTGKTYLAVALAVSAVREGQMRKIVLVRPAVEANWVSCRARCRRRSTRTSARCTMPLTI